MARIDGLLFGYTVFSVSTENTAAFANALLSLGISAKIKRSRKGLKKHLFKSFENGKPEENKSGIARAEIRLSDRARLKERLNEKMEYTESEMRGLPGLLYRNRKRYGTFLGFITAALIILGSSGLVWDVRIEGLEGDELLRTEALLSELGVHSGARWCEIDKNELEAKLLEKSLDVAWININRRGSVAYITVKERENFVAPEKPPLYSNILATEDAIIEEISVKSGYPMVKAGDIVKRGDVLISGVIPSELGGGLCRAEGTVVGRVSERICVNVSETVTEKQYFTDGKTQNSYKILGFSINILKNSRNSASMCDIIKYKSNLELFGKRLPIEKYTTVTLPYREVTRTRSTDELLMYARSCLSDRISEELFDSELLKIKTGGEFTEDGYTMYSDALVLKNIGSEKEILTD